MGINATEEIEKNFVVICFTSNQLPNGEEFTSLQPGAT